MFPISLDGKQEFMATLYGYFDESGKSHDHNIVSFSGFLSTKRDWERLCEEWQRLLRAHGIAKFHFKEHKSRASMVKKFIRLIKNEVEYAIGASINVDAFNALPEALRVQLGGDPHFLIFKVTILAIAKQVLTEKGDILHFTSDEDDATNKHLFEWYKKLKAQGKLAKNVVSFCVADDLYFPQLQASDILAALTRIEAQKAYNNKPHDLQQYVEEFLRPEEGIQFRIKFNMKHFDETDLRGLADDWNHAMSSLIPTPAVD